MASDTYSIVAEHYATRATSQSSTTTAYNSSVASAFGYSAEDLATIPTDANLGLSCGNPLATAALKEGETMIDLGSGAGLDVFLASPKVGKTGKAIGVDMTDSMLELAERNKARTPDAYGNVTFVKANITSIPLPDSSADVITSNCVINLVPHSEKPQVFSEIYRLLKPGGRVAVSDILAKRDFPKLIRQDVGLYVGCISGASEVSQYEGWLKGAGFQDIFIVDTKKDLNVYKKGILSAGKEGGCCGTKPAAAASSCCGAKPAAAASSSCCDPKPAVAASSSCCETPEAEGTREERMEKLDLNEYVGAFQIYAIKPTSQ